MAFFHWGWWLAFGFLALLPAVWAGDTPFVVDEPILIHRALTANAEHRWQAVGLTGTVGRVYGPLPTWLYQLGLRVAPGPVELVRLRAVVVTGLTLAAVGWIAVLIGAGPGWVILVGLSPYLLHYSRILWDNSFNIPLAAIAAALTLQCLVRRSLWPLPVLTAVLGAMLLVHPMSVAFCAGVILTLLVCGPRAWSHKRPRMLGATAGGILLVLALGWILTTGYRAEFVAISSPSIVSESPNGWWFALFSPRLISAAWIGSLVDEDVLASMPAVFDVAQFVSLAVFPLMWAGIVITIKRWRSHRDAATLAGGLAISIIAAQIVLNGITHTFGHPSYYNATWIAAAMLVAVAMIRLRQHQKFAQAAWFIIPTIAASLAITSAMLAWRVHQSGGTRSEGYGPTIANQYEVARAVRAYPPQSPVKLSVRMFPESLTCMFLWTRTAEAAIDTRPTKQLEIRYVHPDDPNDGRIELAETAP